MFHVKHERDVTHFIGILSDDPEAGKTTSAVNLAALLAQAGRRTLLVDCAELPEASRRLGHAGPFSGPLDATGAVPVPEKPGLEILPLSCAEESRLGAFDVARLRESCREKDYVLFDMPSISEGEGRYLEALDRVIILLLLRRFSLQRLARALNVITEIKGDLNPELVIEGVLITQADRRLEEFERAMKAAQAHFPVDFFQFAIPRDDAYAGRETVGSFEVDTAVTSRATRGYVELTMEVLTYDR